MRRGDTMGIGQPASGWNSERVAILKELWQRGASASKIASELRISRSAILGKVHRLKLTRSAEAQTIKLPPAKKSPLPSTPQAPRLSPRLPAKSKTSRQSCEANINETHVTMLELTNSTCRWPIGDPLAPGFVFCGELTADLKGSRPYCPTHTRTACDPTATRRTANVSTTGELYGTQ
jgi:GcrA cell cycle regulator